MPKKATEDCMLQLSVLSFKARSYILIEGKDNANRFYLIKSGSVKTYRTHDTEGTGFKDLGPGDFIGLVSCMAQTTQIESCVAATDVTVICIRKDQYMDLIRENSSIAFKIIKMFSRRMRAMNETLTKLSYSSVVKDSAEHIFEVAEYYDDAGQKDVALFAYYQYIAKCSNRMPNSTPIDSRNLPKAKERYTALSSHSRAVYLNENNDDEMRYYPRDTMIFSESQTGTNMFVIIEGQIKITKIVDGQEAILAILKVGDMLGEMALLENLPRSANAITVEDSLLMVVRQGNYKNMISMQIKLIDKVTISFSKRICLMYRKFDNVNLIEPVQRLIDMLAITVEEQLGSVQDGLTFQTDLTFEDLAAMCGIPGPMQEAAILELQKNPRIQLVKGKIFVGNCQELVNQANFIHNQNDRLQKQLKTRN